MTCASALGWTFIAITVLGCLICTVFALAACRVSGRISREEGDDVYGADEGALTRSSAFPQPVPSELRPAFRQ